jgi:hypothetical protein
LNIPVEVNCDTIHLTAVVCDAEHGKACLGVRIIIGCIVVNIQLYHTGIGTVTDGRQTYQHSKGD